MLQKKGKRSGKKRSGSTRARFCYSKSIRQVKRYWNRTKKSNNNNNNLSSPSSPPSLLHGPGPFIPPPPPLPFQHPLPVFNSFQTPPPRSDSSFGNFHIPAQLSSGTFGNRERGLSGKILGSQTQTPTREKEKEKVFQDSVQKELDDTIFELPDHPRLELGDGLLNSLVVEVDDILEQKYVNKKQEEDAVLEQIKEDYNFDEIKDAFDEGVVPHQLDFFYGGENSNFNQAIEFLSPSNKNREFIAFLLSDQGQHLMRNSSLSIHIESGDIFYNYDIFFSKISTLMKFSTIFYLLNRTIRQPQYQNEFLTLIFLNSTRRIFYHRFQLTMLKNLIYTLIKM